VNKDVKNKTKGIILKLKNAGQINTGTAIRNSDSNE
jgi:hypothetical protein